MFNTFAADPNKPANNLKTLAIKNQIQNATIDPLINNTFNNKTRNITRIFKKKNKTRSTNNYKRNIRNRLDTSAIRSNKYDFYTAKYDATYPKITNYIFCPQKISSIFHVGGLYWTTSTTNKTVSFPFKHNFIKTSQLGKYSINRCIGTRNGNDTDDSDDSNTDIGSDCTFLNYSGEYILNWTIDGESQIVSSSNPDIQLGTFEFHANDDYFEIFLYPKAELNNYSYVHIRYRVPVRFRYAYGDWTYWESLLLDGSLTETEFVKVIHCCQSDQTTT